MKQFNNEQGTSPQKIRINPRSLDDYYRNYTINNDIKKTTFAEQVLLYANIKGITSGGLFQDVTSINRTIYKKFKDDRDYIPDKRIAITICIGLRLTYSESCYLLGLGGMSLIPNGENDEYMNLIVSMIVNNYNYIPDCNECLIRNGFEPLGSLHYNKVKEVV